MGAKQLIEEIEALEKRMADPATVETMGEDIGTMQMARVQMISRLNEMNEPHRGFGPNSQAKLFRDTAHSAMVEAGGVVGPSTFGAGGDRAMSKALARDGETIDEDHLQDLAALYGTEASENVRAATEHLQRIDDIRGESMDANAAGLQPGQSATDYATQSFERSRRSGMI